MLGPEQSQSLDDGFSLDEEEEIKKPSPKEIVMNRMKRALVKQIQAYIPNSAHAKAGDNKAETLVNDTGVQDKDVIDERSWFEWQHTYAVMQNLISKRKLLQNKVGVLPPYGVDVTQKLAEDAIEEDIIWEEQNLPTRLTPNGDKVLLEEAVPTLTGLTAAQKANVQATLKKRKKEAKARGRLAKRYLSDNGLSDKLFKLYLETVLESKDSFLGNPANPNLALNDCEQLIIPFLYNGNHFTTAVVRCYEVNTQVKNQVQKVSKANIKYYDSQGYDLEPELQVQLIEYFKEMGFTVEYQCVSKLDQLESHNCAIFASIKSIDLVNENFNIPERLLGNLTCDNYKKTMDFYRIVFADELKESGQHVKVRDNLKQAFNEHQDEFSELSETSQKISAFNSLLADFIREFEDALAKANEEQIVASVLPKDKPLPDWDPLALMENLSALYVQAVQVVIQKASSKDISAKDVENIKRLQNKIDGLYRVGSDLEREAHVIKKLQKPTTTEKQSAPSDSVLASLSWKKLALFAFLLTVGFYVGLPLLLAGIVKIGPMLPNNPVLLMVLGGGVFFLGTQVVPWLNGYLNAQTVPNKQKVGFKLPDPEASKIKPDPAKAPQVEVKKEPNLVTQFNTMREADQSQTTTASGHTPSAKRKLEF